MIKNLLLKFSFCCITRFPFWEAISQMMLFAEIESKAGSSTSSEIPIPKVLVYADLAILVAVGTFMTFNEAFQRRSAMFAGVHMLLHCVVEAWLRNVRGALWLCILLRYLGICASYFMVSAGLAQNKKAKKTTMISVAYFIYGVAFAGQAYLLATLNDEKELFKKLILTPCKAESLLFAMIPILVFCLSLSSICFLTQGNGLQQARLFSLVYAILVLLPRDYFVHFQPNNKLEFWSWIRLLVANIVSVEGLMVLNLKSQ